MSCWARKVESRCEGRQSRCGLSTSCVGEAKGEVWAHNGLSSVVHMQRDRIACTSISEALGRTRDSTRNHSDSLGHAIIPAVGDFSPRGALLSHPCQSTQRGRNSLPGRNEC